MRRAAAPPHMKVCEADASLAVVQLVAWPMRPRLLSTARTITLLRISARNASYQALRTTSSRSVSAAPAQQPHRPRASANPHLCAAWPQPPPAHVLPPMRSESCMLLTRQHLCSFLL